MPNREQEQRQKITQPTYLRLIPYSNTCYQTLSTREKHKGNGLNCIYSILREVKDSDLHFFVPQIQHGPYPDTTGNKHCIPPNKLMV